MEFTLTIRNKTASLSGISALVCGNSGYRILIDYDAEWERVTRFLYVEIIRADGRETRFFPVPNNAVNLPAFYDAERLRFRLSGGYQKSGAAELPCEPCILDSPGFPVTDYFDLYNAVMQYAADKRNGASASVLAAELTAIQSYVPQPVTDEEYQNAVGADCVTSHLNGTVTLENGVRIPFTEHDVPANSFSIHANAMNGDFLLPGGVPAAELSAAFAGAFADYDFSGAEITAQYAVQCHLNRWYTLPLNTFTVMEANKSGTNLVQITAYDAMMKLDSIPVSKLNITADTAYSPQEILQMIAEAGGISYTGNTDECVNKNCTFILSALDDTIDTLRDLLMYTAQILNCCAYIGRDGALTLARIVSDASSGITGKRKIVQAQVSAQRYQLYTLSTVLQYKENGITVSKSCSPKTLWADGVYADLPENPLLRVLNTDTLQARINAVGSICDDLDFAVYHPAEIVQTSDPSVSLMEWREFESRSGTAQMPVTAYQWTFHGGQTVSAGGTEAIAGIRKTQAEKIASGERTSGNFAFDNVKRVIMLMLIQQGGNNAMQHYTNQALSHFTYAELAHRNPPLTHAEMAQCTHDELSGLTHREIGE